MHSFAHREIYLCLRKMLYEMHLFGHDRFEVDCLLCYLKVLMTW